MSDRRGVTIPCGHCRGKGRLPLTGVYADTLALLARQGTEVTGARLAREAGCKTSAMCNRLAALERLGVAVSRRYGRERLYRAADAARKE